MKHSVFETGYIEPKLKLVESGTATEAFLLLGSKTKDTAKSAGVNPTVTDAASEQGFIDLFVTMVSEFHSDSYTLNNTLSDTVYAFALGAAPINVTITAFALRTPDNDVFLNFLKEYTEKFRGKALEKSNSYLYFGFKDTIMKLYITSVATLIGSDIEEFVKVDIIGVAAGYAVKSLASRILDAEKAQQEELDHESQRLANSRAMAHKVETDNAFSYEREEEARRLASSRASAEYVALSKAAPSGGTAIINSGGKSELIEFELSDSKEIITKSREPITSYSASKLSNSVPRVTIPEQSTVQSGSPTVFRPANTRTFINSNNRTDISQSKINLGDYKVRQHIDSTGYRHDSLAHDSYHPNDTDRKKWTMRDVPNATTANVKEDVKRNKILLQVKTNIATEININSSKSDSKNKEIDSLWESAIREKAEYRIFKEMVSEGYKF